VKRRFPKQDTVYSARRGQGRNQMAAARFQLSALSDQLMNEHYEHAFDLGGL